MEKHQYIEAIENLNREQIQFYNSEEYKKYKNKKIIKTLLENKEYKKAYQNILKFIRNNKKRKDTRQKISYQEIENKVNLDSKKKIVYTCILGDYDTLYSPLIITDNTKYIVFSDNKNITKEVDSWEYKTIPKKIREICHNNDILINRYIKMHPKELFPEEDYALYIDGSIRVISDITDVFNKINNKTGLGMHVHRMRNDVYEEAKACINSKLGDKKKIKELIQKYKKEVFPEKYGLFEATIIASDLKNRNAEEILNNWWEEFLETGTYRDQLTFTYVLWKNQYQMQDVGILGENVETNVKFRKYTHNLKKKKKKRVKNTKIYKKTKKIYDNYFKIFHMAIKRIIYFGKKYQCNLCGSKVKSMFPSGQKHEIFQKNNITGAGYRDHVKCPVCRSKDKERMVFYYIKNYTDILTGKNTILHFAPEIETKKKIKKNKEATYYDGDIQKEVASQIIDITQISFPDNTFDYIICNHVLEHVEDEKKAILELKRVIKENGKIIITVPICISNEKTIEDESIIEPEERLKYFCQSDHVRLYGRDFVKRIEKYGVTVTEYDFEKEEGIEKRKQYGILENGCIYIVTKKRNPLN